MLEFFELFSFKNVCLAKNVAMQGMVTDSQLQISEDIQKTQQQIHD